ncbi:MAG: precorrin-8X methylmutase [Ruminococcus sp.]|uniref:precorrin-8X methylmutase n=1 Tax=Ruminococcus sp. TaxID=41978 RepID=UPI0025F79065|nr:precorrin-8X methylmutase [Ruminococcus sp.]MBR5683629.1 precorrin-8X methylmutase [Ruminococcus sp.]
MELEYILPKDIERRSFEIIEAELGERKLPDDIKPIVMRAIHTTADFDYYDNMFFSENAVETALSAIREGALFVTDTNMAKAGINKAALARHGCSVECFMADSDVASEAAERGITRAAVSVDKAASLGRDIIYAVGNAPTALIRLKEHIESGTFVPRLVIGMPVGFVNVVQSKEMIIESGVPCIVARGRKGGSNVAAAVCNALLYMADRR